MRIGTLLGKSGAISNEDFFLRLNPLVPERKRLPTPIPRLEWLQTDDGSLSLYDAALEESYHSGCGAVAETWHVYVCQSGVLSKLRSRSETIAVLEYGFGTAMGFLLTAAAARVLQAPLRFVSLEKWLLPAPVLEGVHLPLLADPYLFLDSQGRSALDSIEGTEVFRYHYRQLLDRFIEWRTALPLECPDGEYSLAGDDGIQLDLRIGDACHDASVLKKGEEELFDAVYFDAFSPKSSPDLWSVETLRRAHAFLKPDGLFSTYCVSSQVRRQLGEAGFLVERIPGPPGGKREVLRATKVK